MPVRIEEFETGDFPDAPSVPEQVLVYRENKASASGLDPEGEADT